MNDQRVELTRLAKTTITQTDRIVKKFQDIIANDREFDSGMRSMLRSMRSLMTPMVTMTVWRCCLRSSMPSSGCQYFVMIQLLPCQCVNCP